MAGSGVGSRAEAANRVRSCEHGGTRKAVRARATVVTRRVPGEHVSQCASGYASVGARIKAREGSGQVRFKPLRLIMTQGVSACLSPTIGRNQSGLPKRGVTKRGVVR